MTKLTEKQRARLPRRAFAYIDSRGRRRLPIFDEAHVRSALSRFNQVNFESDAARELARTQLLKAARRFGVVPVGFIESQLRKERRRGHTDAQARRVQALPRGAVTFLMTDVEGSTALLAELEDRYGTLLGDMRRLIRDKVRRAGGHEVEVHGDEFLAAFAKASDALEAAVAIQRRARDKDWLDGAKVRIRMGIHRGHPNLTDTGYIGLSVHATARVCQAAHGGQILISNPARDAIVDDILEGIGFGDLGQHRLRGFPRADVLFQVEVDDLPRDFPPLRTSAS